MGSITRYTRTFIASVLLLMVALNAASADSYIERVESWLAGQGYGDDLQFRAVNIFGDGDPENGIEDNRIDMASPRWNGQSRRAWNMSAGTIHCDGASRGSAVVVDTSEFGVLSSGVIVATSAHVLFDLEKQKRYDACRFHFMALDHLPGYQAEVVLELSSIGNFDPARSRLSEQFGKEDWAFLYIEKDMPGLPRTGRLPIESYSDLLGKPQQELELQFISFSKSTGSITISTDCQVRESRVDDLGGGGWPGQLLDNCDSEGGSSGGGLVAISGEQPFWWGSEVALTGRVKCFQRTGSRRGHPMVHCGMSSIIRTIAALLITNLWRPYGY